MSFLCQRCQVIQFDDAEHNGTVEVSPSGESYFEPYHDPNAEEGETNHCLFLNYDLKDVLPDLPVLSQSAEGGCSLCLLMKTEITKFLALGDDSGVKFADLFIHKLSYSMKKEIGEEPPFISRLHALWVCFRLLNEIHGEEDMSWMLRLEIQADPTGINVPSRIVSFADVSNRDPCAKWFSIPRQPVQQDVLSEEGMRRLNELVEIALQIPTTPATKNVCLPTRLIDIGFRGIGKKKEEPRLVLTADYPPLQHMGEDQRYVALSYCWGLSEKAERQLMTKTTTLNDHLHQIVFSALPKTHQDAIQICIFLGVRYIWIDSLCIVQDDKSDWDREAGRMGGVYANAYLTICAAQGDSCLDGFLTRKYSSNVVEVPFKSSLNPSISGSFSIFAARGECAYVEPRTIGEEFTADFLIMGMYDAYNYDKDCNWGGRGWTFQEALLSPRSLLFGERMIHVCSGDELIQSEDAVVNSSNEPPSCIRKDQGANYQASEGKIISDSDWQSLVMVYSRRSLTKTNDILPAISALAKLWNEKVEGQYLAGIFSSNLHYELLWAHEGMRTPAEFLNEKPEQYTAPSWSWASQQDSVTWIWHAVTVFKPEFQLLEGKVSLDGLNPYGRVKSGHLLLSTKVLPIPTTRLKRESEFLGYIFPYQLVSEDETVLAHLRFDWRSPSSGVPKDPKTGEECEDGPIDQVLMVLISSKITEDWYKRGGSLTFQDLLLGLLVLPTGNPGGYRKAGTFFSITDGPFGRVFWDGCSTESVKLV